MNLFESTANTRTHRVSTAARTVGTPLGAYSAVRFAFGDLNEVTTQRATVPEAKDGGSALTRLWGSHKKSFHEFPTKMLCSLVLWDFSWFFHAVSDPQLSITDLWSGAIIFWCQITGSWQNWWLFTCDLPSRKYHHFQWLSQIGTI